MSSWEFEYLREDIIPQNVRGDAYQTIHGGYHNVKHLRISNMNNLTSIRNVESIIRLSVSNTPMLKIIENLPNVREIVLISYGENQIEIKNCKNLMFLRVNDNVRISDMPNLSTLFAYGDIIHVENVENLKVIKGNTKLTGTYPKDVLRIIETIVFDEDDDVRICANDQSTIEIANDTFTTSLRVENASELERIQNLPNVRDIMIENCPRFKEIKNCPRLMSLTVKTCSGLAKIENLSAEQISVEECNGLKEIKNCPALKYVDVSACAGLETIHDIPARYIHVSYLESLREIHTCPNLVYLHMERNSEVNVRDLSKLHTLEFDADNETAVSGFSNVPELRVVLGLIRLHGLKTYPRVNRPIWISEKRFARRFYEYMQYVQIRTFLMESLPKLDTYLVDAIAQYMGYSYFLHDDES